MKKHHFNKSKLSEIMTFDQYTVLNEWHLSQQPVPDHCKVALTKAYMNSKKANLLTRMIMDWIKMLGGFVERTGNTGQFRDNTKIVKDVTGMQRLIGSKQWTKGTGTNGTSDLKAIIHGKYLAIEIKYGKDRMSDAQKRYQKSVEKAGGTYLVVKCLDDLIKGI